MGAYVVRTSSLNDKHSCQLFRMGQIHTHIDHTFNQGQHELCGSYLLLQSCFSFFVRLHGQPEPFGSCSLALLSFSVSMANLSCLLETTFSRPRFLSNSLSSPCFNLLRVARHCFSWFSVSDDLFFPSCVFFCYPSCLIIFVSYPQHFFPWFFSL